MDKQELFNSIAKKYNLINNGISLFTHLSFKKKALSKIKYHNIPENIIDLCCGTGDIIYFLQKIFPKSKIIGVDFSDEMLKIAKNRLNNVEFVNQDISNLPFKNNFFDICTISFGLRNVDDINKVLKEIHRILKPEGIFFNLDLGKPNKFWNIFLKPYMNICVPLIGKAIIGKSLPLKYFVHSNETFPSPKELEKIYKENGFEQIKRVDFLFGQISGQICKKNN